MTNWHWFHLIITIILTSFYVANFTIMSQCALHLVPWSLCQKHSFKCSQLPGEYTAAVAFSRLFHTQYQPLPSQVPIYTPGWREAILVKHLAKWHKCYDWDSNPPSDDLTILTWFWCSKPLSHDTLQTIPRSWTRFSFFQFLGIMNKGLGCHPCRKLACLTPRTWTLFPLLSSLECKLGLLSL